MEAMQTPRRSTRLSQQTHHNSLPNRRQDELDKCLQSLKKKDRYGYFSEPVDSEEVPDYFDIVQYPMDFSKMEQKLKDGDYKTLDQLKIDFSIICNNAQNYNPSGTTHYKAALRLEREGGALLENFEKHVWIPMLQEERKQLSDSSSKKKNSRKSPPARRRIISQLDRKTTPDTNSKQSTHNSHGRQTDTSTQSAQEKVQFRDIPPQRSSSDSGDTSNGDLSGVFPIEQPHMNQTPDRPIKRIVYVEATEKQPWDESDSEEECLKKSVIIATQAENIHCLSNDQISGTREEINESELPETELQDSEETHVGESQCGVEKVQVPRPESKIPALPQRVNKIVLEPTEKEDCSTSPSYTENILHPSLDSHTPNFDLGLQWKNNEEKKTDKQQLEENVDKENEIPVLFPSFSDVGPLDNYVGSASQVFGGESVDDENGEPSGNTDQKLVSCFLNKPATNEPSQIFDGNDFSVANSSQDEAMHSEDIVSEKSIDKGEEQREVVEGRSAGTLPIDSSRNEKSVDLQVSDDTCDSDLSDAVEFSVDVIAEEAATSMNTRPSRTFVPKAATQLKRKRTKNTPQGVKSNGRMPGWITTKKKETRQWLLQDSDFEDPPRPKNKKRLSWDIPGPVLDMRRQTRLDAFVKPTKSTSSSRRQTYPFGKSTPS